MPTSTPALELIAVTRRYRAGLGGCRGEVVALDQVSLRVERAEAVGLVGRPGAGKTTLLLCAAGLLRPDSGTVRGTGSAYVASLDRLEEIGDEWRAVLLDLPSIPFHGRARARILRRCDDLRSARAALLVAARDATGVKGLVSRIVTLAGGRVAEATPFSRTLELDVGMPRHAAELLARQLPMVRLRDGVLRVPLEQFSAEEVLSTCLAAGVRVRASRVLVGSDTRHDRVAERGEV